MQSMNSTKWKTEYWPFKYAYIQCGFLNWSYYTGMQQVSALRSHISHILEYSLIENNVLIQAWQLASSCEASVPSTAVKCIWFLSYITMKFSSNMQCSEVEQKWRKKLCISSWKLYYIHIEWKFSSQIIYIQTFLSYCPGDWHVRPGQAS